MTLSLPILSAEILHPLDEYGGQAYLWRGILDTGAIVCLRCTKKDRVEKFNQFEIASVLRGAKNIVDILGMADVRYRKRTYCCLVMELYTDDLYEHLFIDEKRDGVDRPENLVNSLRTLIECIEGVYSMHKRGFIHLDIKAANFLVNDTLTKIHLTDFGHAVPMGYVSKDLFCGGTGSFIAPELFNPEQLISPKADVYSFGVLICEVLFGGDLRFQIVEDYGFAEPFDGKSNPHPIPTDYEIFDPFMTMIRTYDAEMNPTLERLHNLCARCLYNDPDKRPTIEQLRQELHDILDKHFQEYFLP